MRYGDIPLSVVGTMVKLYAELAAPDMSDGEREDAEELLSPLTIPMQPGVVENDVIAACRKAMAKRKKEEA